MAGAPETSLTQPPEINLARRVLTRFGLTAPVDVIAVARHYADVSIDVLPIDIDGVCYDLKRSGLRPKIVLNKSRPRTRLRFTAAHELGHVLIPWHTGIMVDDTSQNVPVQVRHHVMEEEANRFASELLLPSAWLLNEAQSLTNPIALVAQTALVAEVSPAATAMKLVSLLEPGHIYARVDDNGTIIVSGRSPGTVAAPLSWGVPVTIEARFLAREDHWTEKVGSELYYWWKIPSRIAIPAPEDIRDWRQILDDILVDIADPGPARQHARQSINGVIGSANSRTSTRSDEELYAMLLQRFEIRQRESELYDRLFRHAKFLDFLSQRVAALKH